MENRQKEFIKQSRKKMGAFNSYASTQFLSNKIYDSELPKALHLKKIHTSFISKDEKYMASIPLNGIDNIYIKETKIKAFKKAKLKNYTFSISLPNKEYNTFMGKAKIVNHNTVIYRNYLENTDVSVQALKGSIRILTILNDADAPTNFIYKLNIPTDGKIQKDNDGSIKILDKSGKFIGGFSPAWAIDKKGQKVPTHYEIKGNDTLIQVVEHLDYDVTYPVIADPYGGPNMIYGAYWRYTPKSQGNPWYHYKLTVIPTAWGRGINGREHANQGWNELKTFSFLNYNTRSMEYQYKCHVYFAWLQSRTEYHLEHWRPATSWWNTLRYGCNPPGYVY